MDDCYGQKPLASFHVVKQRIHLSFLKLPFPFLQNAMYQSVLNVGQASKFEPCELGEEV